MARDQAAEGGLDTDSRPGALITIRGGPTMPGTVYYIGRALQVLGMWLLLVAIFTAGPLGPSPRIFGVGVAAFIAGWFIVRQHVDRS